MVFISEPDKNTLVVKDTPVIFASVAVIFGVFFFAIAFQFEGRDSTSMTIFFTLGVCAAFAAIALLKVRKWTFTRNDQKLRVQDIGLLRRQRTDYTFDADSHAEMVISRSNDIEDGNLFNAVFVSQ